MHAQQLENPSAVSPLKSCILQKKIHTPASYITVNHSSDKAAAAQDSIMGHPYRNESNICNNTKTAQWAIHAAEQ